MLSPVNMSIPVHHHSFTMAALQFNHNPIITAAVGLQVPRSTCLSDLDCPQFLTTLAAKPVSNPAPCLCQFNVTTPSCRIIISHHPWLPNQALSSAASPHPIHLGTQSPTSATHWAHARCFLSPDHRSHSNPRCPIPSAAITVAVVAEIVHNLRRSLWTPPPTPKLCHRQFQTDLLSASRRRVEGDSSKVKFWEPFNTIHILSVYDKSNGWDLIK